MNSEYMILNGLIVSGPLILSFDQTVRYVRYWKHAMMSIVIIMLPFLVWDMAVTGRHWHFNPRFVLPVRILGLPVEEVAFFMTVPFACLFIWQIIVTHRSSETVRNGRLLACFCLAAILSAVFFLIAGKTYTGLVCAALGLTVILDRLLNTRILNQRRTGRYLLILTGLILVFNGYLTARPVVLYEPGAVTGIRIGTIPLEDFGYGFVLILCNTTIFERLKQGTRHAR
ncbi:lycopene cyclase domain-containing protein [bacterium]|nr:lycopene cyclase domain-containing protein [bacterium]